MSFVLFCGDGDVITQPCANLCSSVRVLLLAVREKFPDSAPCGLGEVLLRCESFQILACCFLFVVFVCIVLLVGSSVLVMRLSNWPIGTNKMFLKLKFRLDGNIFERCFHLYEGFFLSFLSVVSMN